MLSKAQPVSAYRTRNGIGFEYNDIQSVRGSMRYLHLRTSVLKKGDELGSDSDSDYFRDGRMSLYSGQMMQEE